MERLEMRSTSHNNSTSEFNNRFPDMAGRTIALVNKAAVKQQTSRKHGGQQVNEYLECNI